MTPPCSVLPRCDDQLVRWLVTLSASKRDVERLTEESLADLTADATDPEHLLLELHDPEGDATGDEVPRRAKAVIDALVRHINGFGRLRWGRTFEGVSVSTTKSFDPAGGETLRLTIEPAFEHMLPEDFANTSERLGFPRPALPAGLEVINALDGAAVIALAEANPEVGRVLHLVDLMLEGDDEIDWVAGFSAVEVIEQDLASRQVKGQALRWWTNAERDSFRATANSVEVLGFRARHGKRFGVKEARMTSEEASWFVRRVAAHWLTHLLEHGAENDSSQ
jgi:hypothetical protein